MIRRLQHVFVLLFGMLSTLSQAAQPQEVNFPSLDGTRITAWVFQPDANPSGVVVALHGCSGLYARTGARQGKLSARHQAMADMLVAVGYAVVFPDSLTPRGVAELCTQKIDSRTIDQSERRRDALATMNWVAAQAWASASKIALLGWSHGGSAVLASTDARHEEVMAQKVRAAIAIAFYPGCATAQRANYQPNTSLLLLLGADDDWTAPGPCIELGRSVGAQVQVYANSYHGFDGPVGKVQVRLDIPNGVRPGHGVHVGPNPTARELAHARVREVLRAAFE